MPKYQNFSKGLAYNMSPKGFVQLVFPLLISWSYNNSSWKGGLKFKLLHRVGLHQMRLFRVLFIWVSKLLYRDWNFTVCSSAQLLSLHGHFFLNVVIISMCNHSLATIISNQKYVSIVFYSRRVWLHLICSSPHWVVKDSNYPLSDRVHLLKQPGLLAFTVQVCFHRHQQFLQWSQKLL